MQDNYPVAVLTHNPNGKWGDVRPIIEKQGYYENWNKSINLESGQQILLYISNNVRQIQYLMEVVRVEDKTIDLKLIKKLTKEQMELLSYERLKEHGIKQGTINYSLLSDTQLNKYILNVLNNKTTDIQKDTSLNIKNIILYGSPGVGKTHNMNKLIHLIESGMSEKEIFDSIKNNELNDGVDIDNIKDRIKFVTFHQSFGYEDFIEGFRPNEEGKILLEDGIFKQICQNKLRIDIFQQSVGFFKTECLDNGIDVKQMIRELNSKISHNAPVKQILFEKEYIALLLENNVRIEISNIDLEQWLHAIIHNEIDQSMEDNYISYKFGRKNRYVDIIGSVLIDRVKYNQQYNDLKNIYKKLSKEKKENVYLVIDEINRGNISKIFGELITLIEEDKRDTLEVTLPYSKKPFKIPSNLYIIGTMNSTDKSIALIDIALRRRFTFLKMEPNADLVNYPQAKNIFLNLNKRITETLGADYVLGHSYFMKIENDDDLNFVLEYKIKPLLEEYYYGDKSGLDEVLKICELNQNNSDEDE